GRLRPAGLRIADTALSREHARFTLRGERVLVEDLDSTNGTWRDGEQIQQAELAPGDGVVLGGLPVSVQAFRPGAVRVISSVPEEDEVPAGAAMRKVVAAAARLADARLPVLLLGETGVGKEMMARRIHQGGPRHHRGKLFCLNCAAIPAQLVESTLFGHERGAFTGAAQRQVGAFEEANGGTLFLDEIGELPLAAQAVLLRVLDTGRFARVGSTREITVDVRVIAATHQDLRAMVGAERFRADLFYRLDGETLEIPPLRARWDEIEPLSLLFLRDAGQANGRSVRRIAADALELLKAHPWPGNVRELKRTIERAVVAAEGDEISADNVRERLRVEPAQVAQRIPAGGAAGEPRQPGGGSYREQIRAAEAQILIDALDATGGNQTEAARRLQMPIRTLTHRLSELGLKPTRRP
ncbi:MAG TPA: sigma 54-interacting transcriptional regulator, partial [Candidatus Nanopelagicales bacterium]|nr:sigma 54-interacting transcriptional regulator [Candidatus Nanopelagicales bacterium]